MKRFFSAILAGALLWCALPAVRAEGAAPPKLSAASAVLMDAGTGRVLYEKDGRTSRLIASTTKLMTALVALESGHRLEEVVTVAPEWAGVEGSSIYLRPGGGDHPGGSALWPAPPLGQRRRPGHRRPLRGHGGGVCLPNE